jgi:hypothetical protein
VYQVGHETHAQHYHPDHGGIYFYAYHATTVPCIAYSYDGECHFEWSFTAHLEPIGTFTIYGSVGSGQRGRAEGVRTKEIAVYCHCRENDCIPELRYAPRAPSALRPR